MVRGAITPVSGAGRRSRPVSAAAATGVGSAIPGSRTGAALNDYQLSRVVRQCRTKTELRVVLEVQHCSRRFGNATPSRKGMAERIGVCERTITRAVRGLEDRGVLTVTRDPARRLKDGTYTRARTNHYRLHLPRNTCSHRRDTAVTSKPLRGCNSTAPPARLPLDDPSGGGPPGDDPPPAPPTGPDDDQPTPPPWERLGITPREWVKIEQARAAELES